MQSGLHFKPGESNVSAWTPSLGLLKIYELYLLEFIVKSGESLKVRTCDEFDKILAFSFFLAMTPNWYEFTWIAQLFTRRNEVLFLLNKSYSWFMYQKFAVSERNAVLEKWKSFDGFIFVFWIFDALATALNDTRTWKSV